jgi:hypothetical protein
MLPDLVNGTPLLALAKHALGAAEAYSVSNPIHVRAVVSTQADLFNEAAVPRGSGSREYVVVLQGRFSCGYCGTAAAIPTTTIDPITDGTHGVAVGVGTPDLAKLGRVYDLDPYIKSLKGVSVRIGPLPG